MVKKMSIKLRLVFICLCLINITVGNPNLDENGNYEVDDMILSPSQFLPISSRGQESGQKDVKFRWSNGVVPYKIENAFNNQQKAVIEESIKSLNQELGGCIEIR